MSVCLSVKVVYSDEMAERIEMPFGTEVGLGPIGTDSKGPTGRGQIGEKKERKVKLAGVIERIYGFPVNGSRIQKYFRFEMYKLPCGQLSLHLLDLLKHLSNSAFLNCCHYTFNAV